MQKNRKKIGTILIAFFFIVMMTTTALAATRSVTDTSDTLYESIFNSRGNVYDPDELQIAIWNLNATNGGKITCPVMDEVYPNKVRFISHVELIGSGIDATIFRFGNHIAAQSSDFFLIQNVHEVTIRDMTIDGNKENQTFGGPFNYDFIHTVDITLSNNITIDHIKVINGFTNAIHTNNSEFIRVQYSQTINSADDGIAINQYTNYAWVMYNRISGAGMTGSIHYGEPNAIEIQDDTHHVVVGYNMMTGQKCNQLVINTHTGFNPCSDILVIGNTIVNNSNWPLIFVTGLDDHYAENITIMENILTNIPGGSGNYVLRLTFVKGCQVSHNQIDCGPAGITLRGIANDIHGNLITNVTGTYNGPGIDIQTDYKPGSFNSLSNNNSITENHIINCNRGIQSYANWTIIKNNFIMDTRSGTARTLTYGIILYAPSHDSTIMGNYIDNAKTADIYLDVTGVGTKNTSVINNRFDTTFGFSTLWEIKDCSGNTGAYVTDKCGNTSVANNGTISHGLSKLPMCVTVTSQNWNITAQVTQVTATTFKVSLRSVISGTAVGGSYNVYWRASAFPYN